MSEKYDLDAMLETVNRVLDQIEDYEAPAPNDVETVALFAWSVIYDEWEAEIKADAESRSIAARLGRRGGMKGGKARAAKLSPERRSEIARKAARARWDSASPAPPKSSSSEPNPPPDSP